MITCKSFDNITYKEYAADTVAAFARKKDIAALRDNLEKTQRLESVKSSIGFHKDLAAGKIAQAREKLKSIQQGNQTQ